MLLHAGFEACAKSQPTKTALRIPANNDIFNPRQALEVSYSELDAAAEALANVIAAELSAKYHSSKEILRAADSKVPVTVGVSCREGAKNVLAVLAALKAGVPYVPLDASTAERLRFMAADARAGLVLSETEVINGDLADGRLGDAVRVINLDAFTTWTPSPSSSSAGIADKTTLDVAARADKGRRFRDTLRGASDENSVAYVLYTSGSTGKPKGGRWSLLGLSSSCHHN